MGILDQTTFIERHQFFDGQRLLAADLQGLEAFHREMRELHNRSLHQPGIGNGFAVSGEVGDRQVAIGPGYALDADGREIVLTGERSEPVPPVAGGDDGGPAFYHLTVSYPDDGDLEETETRRGLCDSHGTVRLREEPLFCWVRLRRDSQGRLVPADGRLKADVAAGRKIVLALVEVARCQLAKKPALVHRRDARPADRPRLACGLATPTWELDQEWVEPQFFTLKARIGTAEAAFETVPCYSARLDGERTFPLGDGTDFLIDGLLSIDSAAARPDGFLVRLTPFMTLPLESSQFLELIQGRWRVAWLGVE